MTTREGQIKCDGNSEEAKRLPVEVTPPYSTNHLWQMDVLPAASAAAPDPWAQVTGAIELADVYHYASVQGGHAPS